MSETVTPARRGRDIRRARAQLRAVKYPYIRRRLKPVELLSLIPVSARRPQAPRVRSARWRLQESDPAAMGGGSGQEIR